MRDGREMYRYACLILLWLFSSFDGWMSIARCAAEFRDHILCQSLEINVINSIL